MPRPTLKLLSLATAIGTLVDWVLRGFDLYSNDWPGFWNWLLSRSEQVAAHMSLDAAVMILSAAVFLWAQYGDRLKTYVSSLDDAVPLASVVDESKAPTENKSSSNSWTKILQHHDRVLQQQVARVERLEAQVSSGIPDTIKTDRARMESLISNFETHIARETAFKAALSQFLWLYFRGEAIMDGLKRDKQRWESEQRHWESQIIEFNNTYLGHVGTSFTDQHGPAIHWFYADHNRMYERPENEINKNYTEDRFVMHTYQLRTLVSNFQQYLESIEDLPQIGKQS